MRMYSIGEAAALVGVTAETLRHYDRIGLVEPLEQDLFTSYRYYTDDEIASLKTVILLRQMGLPLSDIRKLLESEDLNSVIDKLENAERIAEQKIAELQKSIERIDRAKNVYEAINTKDDNRLYDGIKLKTFERRDIFVLKYDTKPTVSSLWEYHKNFYYEIDEADREKFAFEDDAYLAFDTGSDWERLFAVCTKFDSDYKQMQIIKSGEFLCACSDRNNLRKNIEILKKECGNRGFAYPRYVFLKILVCGLLKWKYEIQLPLEK